MLRNAEDAPAQLFQPKVNLAVAFTVTGDLGLPKLPVPFRGAIAPRTAVPKASIHEYGQPLLAEGEVGLPWELQMTSPSRDAFLTEELNQHTFRPFIALALDPAHHLGSLLLGEDVGHRLPDAHGRPSGVLQAKCALPGTI